MVEHALLAERSVCEPNFHLGSKSAMDIMELVHRHMCNTCSIRECHPYMIRYKGEDGSLVAFKIVLMHEGVQKIAFVTARTGPDWRLRSEWERFRGIGHTSCHPLRPHYLDERHGVLLLSFPLDRKLRDIGSLLDVRRVRRLLYAERIGPQGDGWRIQRQKSDVSVASFRPERRVVLRWRVSFKNDLTKATQTDVYFLRLHADPPDARIGEIQLRLDEVGFPHARVLARPQTSLTIEQGIPGHSIRIGSPGSITQLQDVGRLLARLHATAPPSTGPTSTPTRLIETADACCRDLGLVDDTFMRGVLNRLERLRHDVPAARSNPVIIHGDCHLHQFVTGPTGLALIDWDRTALGHPAQDLATLHAHLVLEEPDMAGRASRVVEAAYGSCGRLPAESELRWFKVVALLRLANMPYRRVLPRWQQQVRVLLKEVDRLSVPVAE